MSSEAELECRVCRMGGEDDRSLFTPCLCSGSIGLVHQECLEAWLAHSKKDKCELCNAKYQFEPQYAENTPAVIPWTVLFKSTLKIGLFQWVPYIIRILLAIVVWIGGIPLITTAVYTLCMRRDVEYMFHWNYTSVIAAIKYGLILDGIVALSLLILMSFTDFLRFHWARGGNNNNNNNNNNARGGNVRAAANGNANVNVNNVNVAVPGNVEAPVPNNIARNVVPEGNVVLPRRREVDARLQRRRATRDELRRRREMEQRALLEQLKDLEEEIMRRTDEITGDLEPEYVSTPTTSPSVGLRQRKRIPQQQSINDVMSSGEEKNSTEVEEKEDGKEYSDENYRRMSETEMAEHIQLRDASRFLFHTGSLDLQHSDMQHLKHLQELKEQYDRLEEMSELLKQQEDEADASDVASPASLHEGRFFMNRDGDDLLGRIEEDGSSTDSDDEEVVPLEFPGTTDAAEGTRQPEDQVREEVIEENVDEIVQRAELLQQEAQRNVGNNNNNNNNNNNVNNNNMNNLDPDDMLNDLGGANNPGAGDVVVELRLALVELIGINGPFHIMFRNAAYIAAFSSVYIFVFTLFPMIIGHNTAAVASAILNRMVVSNPSIGPAVLNYVSNTGLWRLLVAVQEQYLQHPHIVVHFHDFLYMACGYTTVISIVFAIDYSLYIISEYILNRFRWVSLQFHQLGLIVKIAVLLQMRIFILPISLGSLILSMASNHLFQFAVEDWTHFMTYNAVGTLGLMWICGITFMLTMTISVMQLREVLHPAILSKWIKPQEANSDLIQSLVQESGLTHTRRIITSLSVYIFLLYLLIYTPCCVYHYVLQDAWQVISKSFFHVQFYYFIPEIQVPVELLLCHICFLSILEVKKDTIGHLQYTWLVWICAKLGLSRTLLPLPVLKKVKKYHRKRSDDASVIQAQSFKRLVYNDELSYDFRDKGSVVTHPDVSIKTIGNDGMEVEIVEETLVVGKPMVRPPPGWDSRVSHNASRWSWINEEPSLVEKNVAYQTFPVHFMPRLMVFLLVSWMLLVTNSLALALIPISVGRCFCKLLFIPHFLIHDPLNFVVGLFIINVVLQNVAKLRTLSWSSISKELKYLISGFTSFKTQRTVIFFSVLRIIGFRVITYYITGLFVGMLSSFYNSTSSLTSLTLLKELVSALFSKNISQDMLDWKLTNSPMQMISFIMAAPWSGLLLIEVFTGLLLHGQIGVVVARMISYGSEPSLVETLLQAKVACNNVIATIFFTSQESVRNELFYANLLHQLGVIEKFIVLPMLNWLVLRGILAIQCIVLALCFYIDGSFQAVVVYRYVGLNIITSILYLCFFAIPMLLWNPVKYGASQFHSKIRDENYLIGKRLVNAKKNADPVQTNAAN